MDNMLTKLEDRSITSWSDEKKRDFIKTFKDRAEANSFISSTIARNIMYRARELHYISRKHNVDRKYINEYKNTIGGRNRHELEVIADEKAKEIIGQLPTIYKVIDIIDKDTSAKIKLRDELQKKGQAVADKLSGLLEPLHLSDIDQAMTIGAFRILVKTQEREIEKLRLSIKEIAIEGNSLQREIAKALSNGIPELSKSITKVANEYEEKAVALQALVRRVEEQVLFGDSSVALEMLKKFEQDEVAISENIKIQFNEALSKLNLISSKKLKAVRVASKKLSGTK